MNFSNPMTRRITDPAAAASTTTPWPSLVGSAQAMNLTRCAATASATEATKVSTRPVAPEPAQQTAQRCQADDSWMNAITALISTTPKITLASTALFSTPVIRPAASRR